MSLRRFLRGRAPAPKSRANQSGEPSEEGATRTFRPDDLPEAESPPHRLDLQGHPSDKAVWSVAVLPDGARIATTCEDGRVRVFDARGDGGPLVDIPAHEKDVTGLAVLDDHVLASAAFWDSKLHTWNARTGERMDTIDVGGTWVSALAAVGPETLVAGLRYGAVVFVQHTCGRQLAEVAREERAHLDVIQDIAWHEDVMATASGDKTARVWSLSTRKPLAVLRGHRDRVICAAVNSRYIATGSADETLRLYANGNGFPLVFVLDGLHTSWIWTVQFIGSDLIMSGSTDRTLCFTAVSPDARPVARQHTESPVTYAAITVDGHVAWVGRSGAASVCAPPRAVADAAKEHALVQYEPPPPLQGALVDAHAGRITAGDACRTLLNAERCSASISEWWCGHKLLMLAVERGEVPADCGLEVDGVIEHDYWFKNLYLPTKRVTLGNQDRRKVDQCLAEAKEAGVIEGTQAILVAIEAQLDLKKNVTALQNAGKQMLMALSIALLEQASARAELRQLGAELKHMDRVQKISLLMNAVFSVAPLAGGAAAGAGVAVFGMAPDLIESILGCGVGLQGAATPLVVDRFVRQTAAVIGSWDTVPFETRKSILAAAEGLGMTWEGFCDMIAKANDALPGKGDREVGESGLDVIVVEEVADDEDGGSDEAAVLDGLEMRRREAAGEEGHTYDDHRSCGEECGPEKFCDTEDASGVVGEVEGKIGNDGMAGDVVAQVEDVAKGENGEAAASDDLEDVSSMSFLETGRTEADGEQDEAGENRQNRGRCRAPYKSDTEENGSGAESGEMREENFVFSASALSRTVLPTNRRLNMRELESLALDADQIRQLDEEQTSSLLAAAMVKFKERHAEHYAVIERAIFRAFDRSLVDGGALIDSLGEDQVLEIAVEELNVDDEYLAMRVATRTVLEDRLSSYLESIPRRS